MSTLTASGASNALANQASSSKSSAIAAAASQQTGAAAAAAAYLVSAKQDLDDESSRSSRQRPAEGGGVKRRLLFKRRQEDADDEPADVSSSSREHVPETQATSCPEATKTATVCCKRNLQTGQRPSSSGIPSGVAAANQMQAAQHQLVSVRSQPPPQTAGNQLATTQTRLGLVGQKLPAATATAEMSLVPPSQFGSASLAQNLVDCHFTSAAPARGKDRWSQRNSRTPSTTKSDSCNTTPQANSNCAQQQQQRQTPQLVQAAPRLSKSIPRPTQRHQFNDSSSSLILNANKDTTSGSCRQANQGAAAAALPPFMALRRPLEAE